MGNFNCYNLVTDAGVTFTGNILPYSNTNGGYTIPSGQGNWDAAMAACSGIKPMYLPGNTSMQMLRPNNQIGDGLKFVGEGKGMNSVVLIDSSFSGATTDNVFQSLGHSNIYFLGVKFVGSQKQIANFFKFNSMGASSSTQCLNVSFLWCEFEDIYGHAVTFGESGSSSETHSIDNISFDHCDFRRICNPSVPYTIDTPDSNYYHGIHLNQTSKGARIDSCTFTNIGGSAIFKYGGTSPIDYTITKGNTVISHCRFENVAMGIEIPGNGYLFGCHAHDNLIINPTLIGISITNCVGARTHDNTVVAYEGRTCYEYGGANGVFRDTAISFTSQHPIAATRRTSKPANVVLLFPSGYQNSYPMNLRYELSQGISPNCPDRRVGVSFEGNAQPGYQPTSWDGRTNSYGHDFSQLRVSNATGPDILSEVVTVDDLNIPDSACFMSPYRKEPSVMIAGQRWYVCARIDGSGSGGTSPAVDVNTNQAGSGNNNSYANPLIVNWNNTSKIKNATGKYRYGNYITLPQASVNLGS